jgi:hypothetical protein
MLQTTNKKLLFYDVVVLALFGSVKRVHFGGVVFNIFNAMLLVGSLNQLHVRARRAHFI